MKAIYQHVHYKPCLQVYGLTIRVQSSLTQNLAEPGLVLLKEEMFAQFFKQTIDRERKVFVMESSDIFMRVTEQTHGVVPVWSLHTGI